MILERQGGPCMCIVAPGGSLIKCDLAGVSIEAIAISAMNSNLLITGIRRYSARRDKPGSR